ncbi:hypothetical protein K402DRAFT_391639, partial [Aulographum hederae CBS 113979]
MTSEMQDIEDFELSLTSNTFEETTETVHSLASTRNSRKSSPVHQHCRPPTSDERKEKPESKWIWCKYCSNYSAQSTTNMKQHLQRIHEINVDLKADSSIRSGATETVEALYAKLLLQLNDSRNDLDQEILRRIIDQKIVEQTLLDLIIIRRLPFSCVEWPEWHAFVQVINPQGNTFMPTSHNTIKQRIETWFLSRVGSRAVVT